MLRLTIPIVLLSLALSACSSDDWGPGALAHGTVPDAEMLKLGHAKYLTYCVGCHGEAGDGVGPAARHLDPKPRDFRVGRIKFALVASGKKARDEDYLRVISQGLKGTAMPAFPFIPLHERRALVAYIKTFDAKPKAAGAALAIPKNSYRKKPAKGIRDGEKLYYATAQCHACHPSYVDQATITKHAAASGMNAPSFRSNMFHSEAKKSEWGGPITPPDFLVDRLKNGRDKKDILRVIIAGIGGTAMPEWGGVLKDKQLWALAHYVESIARLRGAPEGRLMREELDAKAEKLK